MSNIEALVVSKDLKNQLTNYKTNTTVSIDACFNICKKKYHKRFQFEKKRKSNVPIYTSNINYI